MVQRVSAIWTTVSGQSSHHLQHHTGKYTSRMKHLCLIIFILTLLEVNGIFFGSKKKNECPEYRAFESKAIACMLQHESALQSKDVKTQCKAYRESTRCMTPLRKQMKDCNGLMPPVDVYQQMTAWDHLEKTSLCSRSGY